MGVQGLWELLSPVGRRVSVETLAGKILAIDASIWIVQFMKAMRDEKGEMVRNAHLIGFFRRICKLMFLRAKPVFVFDGGTPALKRRTVIARRRQRENAKAKVRKTAEKLLLNHLKAMRLKELAVDLESQRKMNDDKGKKVIDDETEMARNNVEETKNVPASFNQEELDALLAASLAAEEDQNFAGNASTSGAGITVDEEEDDEDDDEEMILPVMSGKVDPAVLASLPPSMQLDLLVQMRERLMAENRQKYQKVKKAPAKFSELQIQSYLKTVAFRREIDQVQKSAAGKDMGGVQTSRIASEASREFIFSSSFSGDKEALASAGVHGHSNNSPYKKPSEISTAFLDSISSTSKSNAEAGPVADNSKRVPVEEIETFQDDRGRFQASRGSAMGIRMTRDLQRNLDMIKEIEQDMTQKDEIADRASNLQELEATSYQAADGSVHSVEQKDPNEELKSRDKNFMEICFEDDGGEKCLDDDDDIFARLVAGEANMISSFNSGLPKKHSSSSDFDRNWEGLIDERVDNHPDAEKGSFPSHAKDGDDESEVEWEDDDSFDLKPASLCPNETGKVASKGVLEEEADFQEALRRSLKDLSGDESRSLKDLSGDESSEVPLEDKKIEEDMEMGHEAAGAGSMHQEKENGGLLENVIEVDEFSEEVLTEVGRLEAEAIAKKTISDDPSVRPTSVAGTHDITWELAEKSNKKSLTSEAEPLIENKSEGENLLGEIRLEELWSPVEEIGISLIAEQRADTIQTSSIAAQPNLSESAAYDNSSETTKQSEIYVKESTAKHETVYDFPEKKDFDTTAPRGDEPREFSFQDDLTNPIQYTKADLEEEIQSLSQECMELGDQQRKQNRNMESVSSEMFAECQELLQMFGLPYIIAPMEAEAQCAYMELAGLVDGVVTDDSDAFLFGATSVYKNIFDDRKYVETYFMKDIENELGLSRDKLIRMALLLGSDYTEGVSGIGIVNAIEVVNAFPEKDGFCKFREWIESPDPTILGKVGAQTGSSSRKKGSKVSDTITSCSDSNMDGVSASESAVGSTTDDIDETKRLFMHKHRNVSKNWHIPSTFPNEAVISAYASPEVDKSTDPFSWGKPDHFVLRKLCWEKFGWNVQKADDLLVPVLKEYNKRETQLRLEAFYTFNEKFAKIRSKRIQKAVRGIRGNMSSEMMDADAQETSKSRKKRRLSPDNCLDDATNKTLSETNNTLTEDDSNSAQRSSKKLSRKKKHKEPVPSEEKTIESEKRPKGRGLSGRGRGGKGRGRRMKTPELDTSSSSDDVSNIDCENDMQVEKDETTQRVRKSARIRKDVKYTLDDLESDEPSKEDQHELNSDNPAPVEEHSFKDHGVVGNDAATPGENILEKIGDPSLVECSDGAYLEMGGGFCMEEPDSDFDTGNINSAPKDDLFFQEELPKEYLGVGGGFCLEEDGTDEDSVTRSLDESQDRYAYTGKQKLDSSAPTSEVDFSTSAVSPHQGTNIDVSHTVPEKSLFAMPALKRKRR